MAGPEARDALAARAARSASAGSTACLVRFVRAPAPRGSLGRAHGEARATIRARAGGAPPGRAASTARAWPSVSSPRASIHEHVVGQLEQAQAVRDRRLRAADALGRPRRARGRTRRSAPRRRAPPRPPRGARGRRSRPGRAGATSRSSASRTSAGTRRRCRPRAPRASGARRRSARSRPRPRPDDDRLDHALRADRVGEPGGRLRLEAAPRLARVRVDLLDRQVRELRLVAAAADQDLEAAAEAAARRDSGALDKLHRHLPVGLGAGRAAVVVDRRQAVARRLGQAHGARDVVWNTSRRSAGAPRRRPRPRASCARRPS